MTTSSMLAWRDHIVQLRYLATLVARVHGPTHPDMALLAEAVSALADCSADNLAAQAVLGRRLRELTDDFHPWGGSCGAVQALYSGLAAMVTALPRPGVGDGGHMKPTCAT